MKILTVIGTRPNFIKVAPLSRALRGQFEEIIVHTDQHYDASMSQAFFDELDLPKPKYHLDVGSKSHGLQTAKILEGVEPLLAREKPVAVLVYGDTNSTLGGALAAAKLQIPIIHVESGMRSYNKIPEEINRVLTDHVSELLFCSTKTAAENLAREGITKNVHVVGDLMIDSLVHFWKMAGDGILERLGLQKKRYLLATMHRPENSDSRETLSSIFGALMESGEAILLPMHPRTLKSIRRFGLENKIRKSKIRIIGPVSYLNMITLQKNARKIITDSGGLQKEAYYFNVPCIYLRDVTEWPETVGEGRNVLAGSDKGRILKAIRNFEVRGKNLKAYGNGNASGKIARIMRRWK